MTKLTGPLFSLSASKTLKKLLTFQKRPSGHAVYKYNKPGDVNPFIPSDGQVSQRAVIGALVAKWQALSVETKTYWDNLARAAGYIGTGYHYFIHSGGPSLEDYLLLETGGKLLLETGYGVLI